MLLIGIGLLLVGFGFKVAAVPFHMWAPDVYEGAPTPITAYMAAAVKAAAFAAFLRVWRESFDLLDFAWLVPLWWIAAVTMVFGNVVALAQRNVKRMLAYSSIVHSGYLLVAIAAGTNSGSAAFLFYLLAYTLATFGAFAVVCADEPDGRPRSRDHAITRGSGTCGPASRSAWPCACSRSSASRCSAARASGRRCTSSRRPRRRRSGTSCRSPSCSCSPRWSPRATTCRSCA